MFFKKEEKFPKDEKEEILKGVPLPPPPSPMKTFETISSKEVKPSEFRPPEELIPPKLPDVQNVPKIVPKPHIEIHEKPHVFIKVEKYEEVMKKLKDLADEIQNISMELSALESMGEEEKGKIEDAKKLVVDMEDILKFLNETFTKPEM